MYSISKFATQQMENIMTQEEILKIETLRKEAFDELMDALEAGKSKEDWIPIKNKFDELSDSLPLDHKIDMTINTLKQLDIDGQPLSKNNNYQSIIETLQSVKDNL